MRAPFVFTSLSHVAALLRRASDLKKSSLVCLTNHSGFLISRPTESCFSVATPAALSDGGIVETTTATYSYREACSSLQTVEEKSIEDEVHLDAIESLQNRKPKITLLEAKMHRLLEDCSIAEFIKRSLLNREGIFVLGLDINTISTGFSVLRISKGKVSLITCGRVCTKRSADVLDSGLVIRDTLFQVSGSLKSDGSTWIVGIEDFSKSFQAGRFQTQGLFKLAQLNGIVKYSCLQIFDSKATSWHATTVRSFYGLHKQKRSREDVKKAVFDFVMKREYGDVLSSDVRSLGGYAFEYGVRSGSFSKDNYDVTDSYLVALYSLHQEILRSLQSNIELKAAFLNACSEAAASIDVATSAEVGSTCSKSSGRKGRAKNTDAIFSAALDSWGKHCMPFIDLC